MAEAAKVVTAMVNVDIGSGVVGVFIDGLLHLAKQIIDLDQILVGPGIGGHGQIVLLRQGILGWRRTSVGMGHGGSRLGQILLGGRHGTTAGDGERSMKRHEGATDLAV